MVYFLYFFTTKTPRTYFDMSLILYRRLPRGVPVQKVQDFSLTKDPRNRIFGPAPYHKPLLLIKEMENNLSLITQVYGLRSVALEVHFYSFWRILSLYLNVDNPKKTVMMSTEFNSFVTKYIFASCINQTILFKQINEFSKPQRFTLVENNISKKNSSQRVIYLNNKILCSMGVQWYVGSIKINSGMEKF